MRVRPTFSALYRCPNDTLRQSPDLPQCFTTRSLRRANVIGGFAPSVQNSSNVSISELLPVKVRVREVMARPMPETDVNVSLEEVYRLLLAGNPAVAISRAGRLAGLITRSDLMEYYEQDRWRSPTASLKCVPTPCFQAHSRD
jgi:CBS domain-containing protein